MPHIAETAVPYAILALYDAGVEVTEEALSAMLSAAGIEVEPIWLSVFTKAMPRDTVKSLLSSFDAGAASGAVAAPTAASSGAAAKEEKKEAKKEEPAEEEEMGLSLFD